MKCTTENCPGEYQEKLITQAFTRAERVIVVEDIPARVCNISGDTLLSPEVVDQLVRMEASGEKPVKFVPVFKYKVGAVR